MVGKSLVMGAFLNFRGRSGHRHREVGASLGVWGGGVELLQQPGLWA